MIPAACRFLIAALKHPFQVSTLFESGPRVGRCLAAHLNRLGDDHLVVELGVGSGSVTEHLLARLSHSGQYVGFELNRDLHRYLKEDRFPHLEIHHASADTLADTLRGRKVGAVVSTLPWTLLPKATRHDIVQQVEEILEPGGTFSGILAMHCLWTPSMRDLCAQLAERFCSFSYSDEVWHLPPCRLYCARKSRWASERTEAAGSLLQV
jgi:phospholipid N-methyltransferase